MMPINIRILTLEDAEQVYAICLDANNHETTWKLSSFQGELANVYNVYLGYEVAGQLVGFIGGSLMFESLAVNNFAVSSTYKRQGIGFALLQAFITYATEKGVEDFILEVRVSNKPAITMYEKVGFVQIDCRKNYYEKPVEDAYIFQLTMRGENR